jgi:enterochelin esterase-like enzyme
MLESRSPVRSLEYTCNDLSLGFVLESVLPFARQNLDLIDINRHPGAFGVLGASMGGLMALYAGLRLPWNIRAGAQLIGRFQLSRLRFGRLRSGA